MTNLDQLLIRACKSTNPTKRLQSTYRRFYLNGYAEDRDLIWILTELCKKYNPVDLFQFIADISPISIKWVFGYDTVPPFNERVIKTLIKQIRFLGQDKLSDYITPRRFR